MKQLKEYFPDGIYTYAGMISTDRSGIAVAIDWRSLFINLDWFMKPMVLRTARNFLINDK